MVELLALRASPVGLLVELLAELLGRAISLHLGHGRRRAKGRMAWQDAHIPSDHTAVELLVLHPAAREKLKEMLASNCAHPVRISHCGYETAQRMHDFAHNVHMSLCMTLHTMCAARIAQRSKDDDEELESFGVQEVLRRIPETPTAVVLLGVFGVLSQHTSMRAICGACHWVTTLSPTRPRVPSACASVPERVVQRGGAAGRRVSLEHM